MPDPDVLAAQLARCVELFREAGAKDAQKAEFRALLGLLGQQALSLRDDGARVLVNGAPVAATALGSLVHRLALHNVSEIAVPRAAPAPEVFELIRALAAQPGTEDIPTRLQAAGAVHVRVALAALTAPDASPPPPDGTPLGTAGILRGEPMTDIASPAARTAGVPPVTYDPPPPPAETALPSRGTARRSYVPGAPPEPQAAPPTEAALPPPPPAVPPPSLAGDAPAAARAPAAAEALAELGRDPQAADVGDHLAELGRQVEAAAQGKRYEEALRIVAAIVKLEPRVTDVSARRHFGIALRRMYSKALLKAFAQLAATPRHQADAHAALRRGGADAVEVLLDLLVAAPSMEDRRAAFDALRQMSEGTDQLIEMLDHEKWFVVRNVAELTGELGMERAVPALSRQLGHADERVRKAAALALAKIGSGNASEALRRALRDKSPEVRIQVALGVGGRRSSGLAMPLVVALEEEKEEPVQRELLLALGRIGTPDAVQALIKVSQPAGRLFGRRPAALRVAAVEGLRLAATAAAVGTLEGLLGDGDRHVAGAAEDALRELKKPKPKPK